MTKHSLTARPAAEEFGLDYESVTAHDGLEKSLERFFDKSPRAKILEIKTDINANTDFYKSYKTRMENE